MAQLQGISDQLLQSLVPNALGAFQQGQQGVQQNVQAQQTQQLNEQNKRLNDIKLAQGELNNKAQEANSLLTFTDQNELRINLIKRAQEVAQNPVPGLEAADLIDMANRLGEPNGFNTIQQELKSDLARIQDISSQLVKQRFIGTPQRVRKDGKDFLVGIVQEPNGTFRTEEQELPGQFVSVLGETAEEETEREIREATGKEKGKLGEQLKEQPKITKRVEEEKAGVRLRIEPKIRAAIKLAEADASAKGETLTALNRSRAALPGLRDAVNQLKELAPIATSTLGGRAFDIAVKESGFGSTKGANARAKFIAMINNQVLPLLRETFGAAFTAQEGESLKATMGDPNATPEQKVITLDAFIEQKVRDIESKQREVGETPAQGDSTQEIPEGSIATNPQTKEKVILRNGQWQPI